MSDSDDDLGTRLRRIQSSIGIVHFDGPITGRLIAHLEEIATMEPVEMYRDLLLQYRGENGES